MMMMMMVMMMMMRRGALSQTLSARGMNHSPARHKSLPSPEKNVLKVCVEITVLSFFAPLTGPISPCASLHCLLAGVFRGMAICKLKSHCFHQKSRFQQEAGLKTQIWCGFTTSRFLALGRSHLSQGEDATNSITEAGAPQVTAGDEGTW